MNLLALLRPRPARLRTLPVAERATVTVFTDPTPAAPTARQSYDWLEPGSYTW